MFALFCHVIGQFGKMICQGLILNDGGLANCVCHQDDLMLSSRLAYDLNSDLGRNTWSVSEKSSSIFSRTSWDRAVGACCTEQGAAMDRFGGPLINRVARGEVDPIPFVFFLSLPSPSLFSRYSDLVTAVLPRPHAQLLPAALGVHHHFARTSTTTSRCAPQAYAR
jgi:hypothetical protein